MSHLPAEAPPATGRADDARSAGAVATLAIAVRLCLALVVVLAGLVPALADVPPAVLPADRAALQQVVEGALLTGRPGATVARTMPSGSRLEVVASQPFARRTGAPCVNCRNPCRTFQYRYSRPDRAMVVVDGARCHRNSGRWVVLQTDRVVNERPAMPGIAVPLGPGQQRDAQQKPRQTAAATPAAPPPLPPAKPQSIAPGADADTLAADGGAAGVPAGGEATVAAADLPPLGAAEPAPQAADEGGAAAYPDGPAANAAPTDAAAPAETATAEAGNPVAALGAASEPAPAEPAPDQVAALPQADGVRQAVANAPATAATAATAATETDLAAPVVVDTMADPEIVRLLRQLSYLDPAGTGEPRRQDVRAAIAEFAADERLTLPMPPEEIARHLGEAVDRVAALSSCEGATESYGVCFTAN